MFTYNSEGDFHGYQEWYWNNGGLHYKGFYNNGIKIDYEEDYYISGLEKVFYI